MFFGLDALALVLGFLLGLLAGVGLAIVTVLQWGCYRGCLLHCDDAL